MSMPTTLHINNSFLGASDQNIVREYFSSCRLEPIGPYNDMAVGEPELFATFEELLQNMLNSSTGYHLIVSHGAAISGLVMPITADSSFFETGLVIADLAKLADTVAAADSTQMKYLGLSDPVKNLQNTLGLTSTSPVVRLAEMLVKLRKKKPVISFRACNVGKNRTLLKSYQDAFAAPRVMAPTCTNVFVKIVPGKPNSVAHLKQLGQSQNTAKVRWRFFPKNGFPDPAPDSSVGPLVIKIESDSSGYPSTTYVHAPTGAHLWAERLNRSWTGPTDKFAMSVMWDDTVNTFHCPAELGYTRKLAVVS